MKLARTDLLRLIILSAMITQFPLNASALGLTDAVFLGLGKPSYIAPQRELYSLARMDRWKRFVLNEPQLIFIGADDGASEAVGISEVVSFPGKGLALSHLDAEKERSLFAEYSAKKYELANQIAQTYLDCATAKANFDQQAAITVDLETLARSIKARYESGHGTQSENISAELQLRQQKTDLEAAEDKKGVSCRALATLLNIDEEQASSAELGDDLDEKVISELGANNADEDRLHATIRLSEATSSVAWWSQLPDLTFGAAKNHYLSLPASPSGKEWTMTYSVMITVPLFFPFYETTEARRMKSQASVDRYTAEIQLIHVKADKEDAGKTYQRSSRRLRELRSKDLMMAHALMESTLSSYRTGKLGFAELVLARKTLIDLKAQDIQIRNTIITARLKCLSQCQLASSSKENHIP